MSRSIGPAFDLLAAYDPAGGAFFERGGLGVACNGPVLELSLGEAVEGLRRYGTRTGSDRPIGVGAVPFAGSEGGALAVGATSVRRTAGGETLSVGAPRRFSRVVPGGPREAFADAAIVQRPDPAEYAESVCRAVDRIRDGALRKVVLARTVEVRSGRQLEAARLLHRLRAVNPDAYVFAVPGEAGPFVGASPELLVSRRGRVVASHPLAGSAARSGDPDMDRELGEALRTSSKNLEEHALVVDAIAETLRPLCERLSWDPEPVLLATPNVWHLSTRFEGDLREPAPSVIELVRALHPTPAVAGTPTEEALAVIADLEPFRRGLYAGAVGWVDANGDGEWAIALRCAQLVRDGATLYAGAGIVAASDPDAEAEETDRKFRAFLDALRWS